MHTYVISDDVTCSNTIAVLETMVGLQINVIRECLNCKMPHSLKLLEAKH